MYEVFLLCDNRTVSLELVMNVLRWILLPHCIYKVSNCVCNLTFLGYESWQMFWGPGKFCKVLDFL